MYIKMNKKNKLLKYMWIINQKLAGLFVELKHPIEIWYLWNAI